MKSKHLSKRIALIEFDSSHDECLLTQVKALKNRGCWVLLVTNDLVKRRNQHLAELVDEWNDIDPRSSDDYQYGLTGAAIGDAMIIRRLMRSLKKLKVDKVVFNTAQGGHVRNACLFSLFRKTEFIGVVHTIRKFQGSFTQRIINLKIKKYFVLAEFLKESVISTPLNHQLLENANRPNAERSRSKRKIRVQFFYPLDFPKTNHVSEESGRIHISIIGSVETRRKDLEGFVSLVKQCDSSVQFSFLGKADPKNSEVIKLKSELKKAGCLDRVEFYENRIAFNKIDQILRKTSVILPLIHPDTPSANEYFRHQIPGSMNLALAYKIPLLLHEHFQNIKELNAASCYYEMNKFSFSVDEIIKRHSSIQNSIESTEVFSNSWNQNRYVNFVFS